MPEYECRICGRVVQYEDLEDVPMLPFCGERCKLIDLGKWFDGEYGIDGDPASDEDAGEEQE